tara:strand:- start:1024 stop:2727 length:1704 start_codon:yes stop_codon:yes gene_type:complete
MPPSKAIVMSALLPAACCAWVGDAHVVGRAARTPTRTALVVSLDRLFSRVLNSDGLRPEVEAAAQDWAGMSAAVAVSGGARSDFASRGGYPDQDDIETRVAEAQESLSALLQACEDRAPALIADEAAVLPLARLAVWVPQAEWVRPLEEWDAAGLGGADASSSLRSLTAHLLETWETPSVLHGALAHRGEERGSAVTEAAHRVSYAFTLAQAAAGAGTANVRDALGDAILGGDAGGVVSKAVSKHLVATSSSSTIDPLHALRRAQVRAQKGEEWVGDGVCRSRLGRALLGAGDAARDGSDDDGGGISEAFGASLVGWVCTHAEELQEPSEVAAAIDFALEMRREDPKGTYSLAGRTPGTIAAAMEAWQRTNVEFERDEAFEPNPRGISGLFVRNATIPANTRVYIPYDDPRNGGPDEGYELGPGSAEGRGARPCTVRIAEISSLRRLVMEGQKLNNCLENKRDSQLKYVLRARQRVSSFWSFTFTYDDDDGGGDGGGGEPEHVLLAEVWHLRQGNVVRQAEGPRPRTLPGPEAWYWLGVWCERENVNRDTWDIYSRVIAPVAPPPVQ